MDKELFGWTHQRRIQQSYLLGSLPSFSHLLRLLVSEVDFEQRQRVSCRTAAREAAPKSASLYRRTGGGRRDSICAGGGGHHGTDARGDSGASGRYFDPRFVP